MRETAKLFGMGIIFFVPVAAIYAFFSHLEPVGSVGILLLGLMTGMVGLYLQATVKKLERDPADNFDGRIADGAGDYGFFSPHSWWPLPLAFAGLLLFLGLAVGWWVFMVGVLIGIFALVGWTFEYFRGDVL